MKSNLKQLDYDIAEYRNGPIHLNRQNVLVKRREEIDKVAGQRSFRQTMFADYGNRSPYALSWKLSACELHQYIIKVVLK